MLPPAQCSDETPLIGVIDCVGSLAAMCVNFPGVENAVLALLFLFGLRGAGWVGCRGGAEAAGSSQGVGVAGRAGPRGPSLDVQVGFEALYRRKQHTV